MIGAYTREQVQQAEAALMKRVPAGSLMQQASYGLAQAVLRLLRDGPGVYGARVAMLVGPGGNGGDALWAGYFLRARGVQVDAVLVTERTFEGARKPFEAAGGTIWEITDDEIAGLVERADVLIDGIAGLGSGRPVDLPEPVAKAVAKHPWVVAVDLPSGVAVDTGAAAVDAIRARLTLTFGCLKPAHLIAPGAELCGQIEVVDIGLTGDLPPAGLGFLDHDEVFARWPLPGYAANKYSTGVVAIAAGSAKYAGAAVLAVGGALRAKPGMVRFVGESPASDRVIEAWPECVVSPAVDAAGRTDAWVVGPGIGTDERGHQLVDDVLGQPKPVVIDADALTVIKGQLDRLTERAAPSVLTPHSGEFERIFFEISDPWSAAQRAADESGCTVLLKGPTTIVAAPGKPALVNRTGSSRLATAGTGDVLSGMIGALLASGLEPRIAAAMAAHLHGAAALAADGPIIASDLPGLVHEVLAANE